MLLGLAAALVSCAPARSPPGDLVESSDLEAESEAPAELGRKIATSLCARCHALEGDQPSPHPAALPFPVLARRWPAETLLTRLEEGIQATHPDMPEVRFAPAEIDPFLAFWSSL